MITIHVNNLVIGRIIRVGWMLVLEEGSKWEALSRIFQGAQTRSVLSADPNTRRRVHSIEESGYRLRRVV